MKLTGKHILLGISGSIAAYKVPELVRFLQREGATVQIMVTPSALNFVTPLTLKVISGFRLLKSVFEEDEEMLHIQASRKADLILLAPATANLIAKLAYGMADDIISTTVLASKTPILIAPAMNGVMWQNPLVQENVMKLRKAGYHILEPDSGLMACGEFGHGRLVELDIILHAVKRFCTSQDLRGKIVLINGGATREYLDPVRFLSNDSSGTMAIALVLEAYYRGAQVVFISGHTDFLNKVLPPEITVVKILSTRAMYTSVLHHIRSCDIFVSAAAISDYTFKKVSKKKIKKTNHDISVILTPTMDILREVLALPRRPLVVGFSLETQNIFSESRKKFQHKAVDLMVLNSHKTLRAETSKVSFLSSKGLKQFPVLKKSEVAKNVFDFVLDTE